MGTDWEQLPKGAVCTWFSRLPHSDMRRHLCGFGDVYKRQQYYRNEQIKQMIDEKYGEGASDFFAQAIENYYKVK